VILQSRSTSEKIIAIHTLMQETEEKMSKLNLDYHKITKILFSKPFLTVSEFSELMGYTRQTATKYIQLLEENKLIS